MNGVVTVAIPTRDAGPDLRRTLAAVRAQRVDSELELLVCDSGSSDETPELARSYGATVIEIPPQSFSHGGTRNLLMERARGEHVAFLTQDAVPAADDWLASLLTAFGLAPAVGLAFGPYRPRPDASVSVARELTAWFDSLSSGGPVIDALEDEWRAAPPRHFLGRLGFFTDANGCIARAAWTQVPFRHVAYAEDQLLAQDMLRAGFAKVYVPAAAVIHSHDYSAWGWVRRSFDEARALQEIYGWSVNPRTAARNLRGNVAADRRWARAADGEARRRPRRGDAALLTASLGHHGAVAIGELLGGRAQRLPESVVRRLSLEGRG